MFAYTPNVHSTVLGILVIAALGLHGIWCVSLRVKEPRILPRSRR